MATMKTKQLGMLLLISGPSGVGKSSVIAGLRRLMPELRFSVSCTTRPPRPGETDGVEYHFLSAAEFATRVAAGAFLEHAEVHGHRYGTLRQEVSPRLEAGNDVILEIDLQGARLVAAAARDDKLLGRCLELVFVGPPSFAELEKRLRARGTEAEEAIRRRLDRARIEMDAWREYDYLIVNRNLERAVADLAELVAALRRRIRRMEEYHA